MDKIKYAKDGLVNLITKAGTQKDKKLHDRFMFSQRLTNDILADIERGYGLAKKIIKRPALDMIRKGWVYENDHENEVVKAYKKIGVFQKIKRALELDRQFGGSALIVGVDDGGSFEDPMHLQKIKKIDFIRVVGANDIEIDRRDIVADTESKMYKKPLFYRIRKVDGTGSYKVHYSRIHLFYGEEVTRESTPINKGFGDSVIQSTYDSLLRLLGGYSSSQDIISDFIQTVLKDDQLQSNLMNGKEKAILDRLNTLDMGRSTMNTVLLGKGEEYTKSASSVGGLSDLLDSFAIFVSAESGIPVTLLMGRSPAGQNATGAADFQSYYDMIEGLQMEKLYTCVNWLTEIFIQTGDVTLSIDELGELIFNKLKTLSEKEQAEVQKLNAETDKLMIEYGVLTPDEVRSRYLNGYSNNLTISEETADIKGMNNPESDVDEE